MSSSTAPPRSATSMARMTLGTGAAARAGTVARAPAATRPARRRRACQFWIVSIALLLEVQRCFPGELLDRLGLVPAPVRLDGPLAHYHLAGADGGHHPAVLADAGAAADGVADAVGGLQHGHRVGQAGHHRHQPELLQLEPAQRGVAAGDDAAAAGLQLGEEAAERVALADRRVDPLRRR